MLVTLGIITTYVTEIIHVVTLNFRLQLFSYRAMTAHMICMIV